jgi:hypothetical protein
MATGTVLAIAGLGVSLAAGAASVSEGRRTAQEARQAASKGRKRVRAAEAERVFQERRARAQTSIRLARLRGAQEQRQPFTRGGTILTSASGSAPGQQPTTTKTAIGL